MEGTIEKKPDCVCCKPTCPECNAKIEALSKTTTKQLFFMLWKQSENGVYDAKSWLDFKSKLGW